MRGAPGRASWDLALVSAGSLASLLLMALPGGGLPKALALVPMVLFLPGYAVTAAMFPPGSIARAERFVHTFTLGFGAAVLGGLVWQILLDLDRFAWAFLLTSITLVACLIAQRRRVVTVPRRTRGLAGLPRPGVPTGLALLGAIAAGVAAIAVAVDGVQEQRAKSHFSGLWAVSRPAGQGGIEVGIDNHQGAAYLYRLTVTGAGRTIRRWEGRLGSRERKRVRLEAAEVPTNTRLVVSLDKQGTPYRSTELQTGPGT